MSIINIQQKLKAKKGQRNAFGNYNYRSAEDILESVKPLLAEAEMYLTISDCLEYIGDRYYIKATAVVRTIDNNFVAEETLFLDDSIQHIEGAKQLGINTVHITDKPVETLFADFLT